ncbi:O-antigen ligase family protein [Bosea sp. BK604]|uniref:O-antigen ligase family protein n=1 Tax=Bosea sp. BK604 TaxID=2512180 RepID=UPI001042CB1E|nr:O-antigen ligase family protein [Bosea sp. BK604]TCR64785.1 O-antigen ligase [Bosea sp. BK604]
MSLPSSLAAESGAAISPSRRRRSQQLVTLGGVLLVALPLAMWAANRSAPLIFGLAALAFLAAMLVAGRAAELLRNLASAMRSPIALALAGFLLWALVSLAWSHRPAASLSIWGELVLPLVCGLVIAAAAQLRPRPAVLRALAITIILACALVAFELASGLSQRIALGLGKQMSFVFNRPIITCIMLAAPVVHGLWSRPGASLPDRLLAALTALAVIGCTFASESGAAKFGLLMLIAGWAVTLLLPRLSLAATMIAFAATLAVAPVLGRLADRAIPPSVHAELADSHSRDRVNIWLSFGEAIQARPIIGSGFGASAALQTHPVAAQVSEPRRLLLAVGHPHSAPVQIWVETGLIGAVLIGLAGLAFLVRLRRLPARDLAPRLAVFVAAFAMASVGHGAWQGWWIALLAAAAVWFYAERNEPAREVEHV